jgi:DNA repair protein RadC
MPRGFLPSFPLTLPRRSPPSRRSVAHAVPLLAQVRFAKPVTVALRRESPVPVGNFAHIETGIQTMSTIQKGAQFAHTGGGDYRQASAEEILAAARAVLARRVRRGTLLTSPKLVRDFLTVQLGALEHEVFCVAYLDNRHRLIEFVQLFRGTIDGASMHPREVVKQALQLNAAAVIFAHPHPSGIAEPSQADELITHRLREALALVEIRVLDHLIVAGGDVASLAERGVI